jgi:hypothetical protein
MKQGRQWPSFFVPGPFQWAGKKIFSGPDFLFGKIEISPIFATR